jgi:hypothetical protein
MGNIKAYEYHLLSEKNAHLLIELYQKVFKVMYTEEQIRSKYFSTYSGIRSQGHFAFFEGRPVAFHGAIPVLMKYQNQVELAAQYGDAMTLPDHTGNGLFTQLGKLTDAVLQDIGVQFVWGFPNQNSEYGYVNKLNWQGESRMKGFNIPVTTIPSELILRKTKLLERKNQERIKQKLSAMMDDTPIQSIDTNISPSTDRSNAYFDYKCFSQNYRIRLNDIQIWIKPKGGLLVGDIAAKTTSEVKQAVEDLKQLAKDIGLHKIVIQSSPNSLIYESLKNDYESFDSWLIGYKNFSSEFPLDQLALTYGDLDTF